MVVVVLMWPAMIVEFEFFVSLFDASAFVEVSFDAGAAASAVAVGLGRIDVDWTFEYDCASVDGAGLMVLVLSARVFGRFFAITLAVATDFARLLLALCCCC